MEQLGDEKGWSQDHNRYGKIHKTKDCLRRREAREQRIGKGVRKGWLRTIGKVRLIWNQEERSRDDCHD